MQTHTWSDLTCHKAAVGCMYWTRSVCLNQVTNRVQAFPLVHSALSILLLGLFSGKELSYGCSSTLDQCYEQCRQTAAKKTGPCLESPAPPGSDRFTNGGLCRGPQGPLTTKQAPKDSPPLLSLCVISQYLHHFHMALLTSGLVLMRTIEYMQHISANTFFVFLLSNC